MRRILTSVVLLVLLFPSLAMGEEVTKDDLVHRNGLFYKKFADVLFTGTVTGRHQGEIKNGKRDGPWVYYHDNGQLKWKGTYKDAWQDGPWVRYRRDGSEVIIED